MKKLSASDSRESHRLVLRLFVAADSPNSTMARANLLAVLSRISVDDVDLEMVDVVREPERGLHERVLVTPTLVKVAPLPERRIIGVMHDHAALAAVLGIEEGSDE